jgi:hypothetical protein
MDIPSFVIPSSVVKEGPKWEGDVVDEPVMVAHIVCWDGVCEVGLQKAKLGAIAYNILV